MASLCRPAAYKIAASGARWGVLGAGNISNDFCLALLHQGSTIATIAARDQAKAQALIDRLPASQAVALKGYEAVWQRDDVDIVYISTITSSHFELAMECLEHGKCVLIEKPLALTEREASVLVATAQSKGLFMMEGMWTRCFPVIRKVRELLQSGRLGKCVAVQSDFGIDVPFDAKHRLWDIKQGGGGAYDVGVYPIGAALMPFEGRPDGIASAGIAHSCGVDESGSLSLSWKAERAIASVSFGITGRTPETTQYVCEKGYINILTPAHCPTSAEVHYSDGKPEVIEEKLPSFDRPVVYGNSEGFIYQVQEVERCLAGGLLESPVWTHQDSLNTMRIINSFQDAIGLRPVASAL